MSVTSDSVDVLKLLRTGCLVVLSACLSIQYRKLRRMKHDRVQLETD